MEPTLFEFANRSGQWNFSQIFQPKLGSNRGCKDAKEHLLFFARL